MYFGTEAQFSKEIRHQFNEGTDRLIMYNLKHATQQEEKNKRNPRNVSSREHLEMYQVENNQLNLLYRRQYKKIHAEIQI
jgi:hypothetical protein